MNIGSASLSVAPVLSPDLLSGNAGINGATTPQKLKAACKAIEGLFAGQLMSEIGKGLDGADSSGTGGLYQSFIQQALGEQVTSGGGFGLAKMLESSLTPKPHHLPASLTTPSTHDVTGTR